MSNALGERDAQVSPRNHLTVPQEFPSQAPWCLESEPNRGIRSFFKIALGIWATNVRLHPARAGRVYGYNIP